LDSLQREEREVRRDNGCYRREEDLTVHRDLCSADDEEKRQRGQGGERDRETERTGRRGSEKGGSGGEESNSLQFVEDLVAESDEDHQAKVDR
jgi:hypothetical protein